ncbi:glycosyltransferase [bacterium]|nr:glycosyltransferase [candidate division CSSED10-310 bacterium]
MEIDLKKLERSRNLHKTYFEELNRLYQACIPEGMRVLELGCHTGRLLASLKPSYGLGIDINPEVIAAAQHIHDERKALNFIAADVQHIDWSQHKPFDYIILSDLTPLLRDIQSTLSQIHTVCRPDTRIILNFHNNLWQPLLNLASLLGLRKMYKGLNWLSTQDIKNLLYLSEYDVITSGTRVLLPFYLPIVTSFLNRFVAKLPGIRHLCLTCYIIARPLVDRSFKANINDLVSTSVVIPTRNEKGNIPAIFKRVPRMGKWTELIFVDGHSTDGTLEAIEEGIKRDGSKWHRTILLTQQKLGKGEAVREAFESCEGDILMILDSDLTMPPEDLPKYYEAIVSGKGEFINGCRLVYPMEHKAMRFLNMIANKLFAMLFTWLLDQPVKDTLCGTKVLLRRDYQKIAANRSFFGNFDPFGDFDLLFGASRLNLKIVDLPIRYRERTYGDIKINRWKHGWLLLKMCAVAFRKLKLN